MPILNGAFAPGLAGGDGRPITGNRPEMRGGPTAAQFDSCVFSASVPQRSRGSAGLPARFASLHRTDTASAAMRDTAHCRDPPAGRDWHCSTGGHVTGAEQVYIVRVPVFWVLPLPSTVTIGSDSLVQVIAPSVPLP